MRIFEEVLFFQATYGIACWLKRRTRGYEFESRQERQENFLLPSQLCVQTLIRCPFHPRVTGVARKRPRSFCQKCRRQVIPKHAYTLTHRSRSGLTITLSRHSVGKLSGTELTRNSSGNTRLQSSRLAEPLWNDPGLKSGISVRELI